MRKKFNHYFLALAVLFFFQNGMLSVLAQEVEITQLADGVITAEHYDSPDAEGIENLIDKNKNTKYLTFNRNGWVMYKTPTPYVLTKYSITSGNDAPERDPKQWVLEGSNNGVTFFPIDERNNMVFSSRKGDVTISRFDVPEAYIYFRLNILSNNGANILQMAEWRLFGTAGEISTEIFPDFSYPEFIETSLPVAFTNASLNATSYQWTFQGGTPETSTEENPTVVYESEGEYEVTLIASDGNESKSKTITVKVYKYQDWSLFEPPAVTLVDVNTENPGYQKYMDLMQLKGFASIEEFVQSCCLTIAKELYYTPLEANRVNLKNISYKFNEGGALSYKAGSPPNIEIGFDMNYLNSFSKTHADAVSADEIYGVLCHEICHGYQAGPRGAGGYTGGTEYFGFIEGSADMARLLTGGFNPRRYPSPGGTWTDGYNTTAFFYQWITNNYDSNFLKELNKTAITVNPWSLSAATQKLYGKTAEKLWTEYQNFLTGNTAAYKTINDAVQLNVNPYAQKLKINHLKSGDTLRVFSSTGQMLISAAAQQETEVLDIDCLNHGVYVVLVSNTAYNAALKFCK